MSREQQNVFLQFLSAIFQGVAWITIFYAVATMPLGLLRQPALLALLVVLVFDVWRQQRRRKEIR